MAIDFGGNPGNDVTDSKEGVSRKFGVSRKVKVSGKILYGIPFMILAKESLEVR